MYLLKIVHDAYVDGIVGFGVVGFALGELAGYVLAHLFGCFVEQQWSHGASHAQMLVQHVWRRLGG